MSTKNWSIFLLPLLFPVPNGDTTERERAFPSFPPLRHHCRPTRSDSFSFEEPKPSVEKERGRREGGDVKRKSARRRRFWLGCPAGTAGWSLSTTKATTQTHSPRVKRSSHPPPSFLGLSLGRDQSGVLPNVPPPRKKTKKKGDENQGSVV